MSRAKKLKEWEKLRNIDAESNAKILSEDQYVKIAEVLSLIEHNQLIDENLVGLGWRVGPNLEWARDELWQLEPIYLPPYSRCIKAGKYDGVLGVDYIFRVEDVMTLAKFNHQYLLTRPSLRTVDISKEPWNSFTDFRGGSGRQWFLENRIPMRVRLLIHSASDPEELCREDLFQRMLRAQGLKTVTLNSKPYFIPSSSKAYFQVSESNAKSLLNARAYRCGFDYFEPSNLIDYYRKSPEKARGGDESSDSDVSTSPASSQASTPQRQQAHAASSMTVESPDRVFSDQQDLQVYLMEEKQPSYGPVSQFLKNLGWKSLNMPRQAGNVPMTPALCSARIITECNVDGNTLKQSLHGYVHLLDYYIEGDDNKTLIQHLQYDGVEKFLRDRKCYFAPPPFTVEKFKSPLKDKSTGKTDSSAFTIGTSMIMSPQQTNQAPTGEEHELERRLFQLKPFIDFEEARLALVTNLKQNKKPLSGTVAQLMSFFGWKMRLYDNEPYFCPPRIVKLARSHHMFDSLGFYFTQDPRLKYRLNVDFFDFPTLVAKLKADADRLIDPHFTAKEFEEYSTKIIEAVQAIYRDADPKIESVKPLLKEFGWCIYWHRDWSESKYLSPYMISVAVSKGYITNKDKYMKTPEVYTGFKSQNDYFDAPHELPDMFRQMKKNLLGFLRSGYVRAKPSKESVQSATPLAKTRTQSRRQKQEEQESFSQNLSQSMMGSPEYFKPSPPKIRSEASPFARNAGDEMDISPLSDVAGDEEESSHLRADEQAEGEAGDEEGSVASVNTASTMSSFKRELQSGNTPYRVLRSFLKDLGWKAVYLKCDVVLLVSPIGLQKDGQNGFVIRDRGSYLSVNDHSSLTLMIDYFDESNDDQKEVILQLMRASQGRYGQHNFTGFTEEGKLQVYAALLDYCEHGSPSHRLVPTVILHYLVALGWCETEQDDGQMLLQHDDEEVLFSNPDASDFVDEVTEFVSKQVVILQKKLKLLPTPPKCSSPVKAAVTCFAKDGEDSDKEYEELVTELHNGSPFQVIRTLLMKSHDWGVFYINQIKPLLLTPYGRRDDGPYVFNGVYITLRSKDANPQSVLDFFDEQALGHRELLIALLLASRGQYGQVGFTRFDAYGINIMYMKLKEYLDHNQRPSVDTVWLYLKAIGWQERFTENGREQFCHVNYPRTVFHPDDARAFLRDDLPAFLRAVVTTRIVPGTISKKKASDSKKSSSPASVVSLPIAAGVLGDLQIEVRQERPSYSTILECLKHFGWSIRYLAVSGGYKTLLCTPHGLQSIARFQLDDPNKNLFISSEKSLALGVDYFDNNEHQLVLIEVLRATNGRFAEPSFQFKVKERDDIFHVAFEYSQTRRMLPDLIPVFMQASGWIQEGDYLYSHHFLTKMKPQQEKVRQHRSFTENKHYFNMSVKEDGIKRLVAHMAMKIHGNIISPDVAGKAMIQPSSDISTHPQRMDEVIDVTSDNELDDENDVTRDAMMAVDYANDHAAAVEAEEELLEKNIADDDDDAMDEDDDSDSDEDKDQTSFMNTRTRRATLPKATSSNTATAFTRAKATRGSTKVSTNAGNFKPTTREGIKQSVTVKPHQAKDRHSKQLLVELNRDYVSFSAIINILLEAGWKKMYYHNESQLCTPALFELLEENGYTTRKGNYLYVDTGSDKMPGERDIDYFSEMHGKNQLYAIIKGQGVSPKASLALQKTINLAKQDYAESNIFAMTTRSPRKAIRSIHNGEDDYDRMTYDNHLGSPDHSYYHDYDTGRDDEYLQNNTTKMDVDDVSNDFYDMKIGRTQEDEDLRQVQQLAGLFDTNFNTEINDAELKQMVSMADKIKFEAIFNHLRAHHGWHRDLNDKSPLNKGKLKDYSHVYFCEYAVNAETKGLTRGEDYFYTEDEVLVYLRELLEINTDATEEVEASNKIKKGGKGGKKRSISASASADNNDENNMNASNKKARRQSSSSSSSPSQLADAMDVDDNMPSSQESSAASSQATVLQAPAVQVQEPPRPRRMTSLAHAQCSHEVNIHNMTVQEYLTHAHHQLQAESGGDESTYPIPFREQECMIIKDTILSHLERGQGGLVYVCGSAGGGKTLSTYATLRNIIEMIRQSDCYQDINILSTKGGMDTLPDVMSSLAKDIESSRHSMFYSIYSRVPTANELMKKDYKNKSKGEIMELINEEFKRPAIPLFAKQDELVGHEYLVKGDNRSGSSEKKQKKKAVPMTILLVDELLDYDRGVLEPLLKLACHSPSSLLILGTGNSVVLPALAESSPFMTRLIFETYGIDALSKLLHNRVQGLFDPQAEKFFIGKIARVHHSDPRRLLEFADAALTYAIESRKLTDEQLAANMSTATLLPLVKLTDVRYVIDGPSLAQKFARLEESHMQIIVALVTLGAGYGVEEERRPIRPEEVIDALNILNKDLPKYDQPSLDTIVDSLQKIAEVNLMTVVSPARSRKNGDDELPIYAIVPGLTCSEILKGLPDQISFNILRRHLQSYMTRMAGSIGTAGAGSGMTAATAR